MDLNSDGSFICQLNDTLIVQDERAHQLKSIGKDGNSRWSYFYSDPLSMFARDNSYFCFIDHRNDTQILVCLGVNGTVAWSKAVSAQSNVFRGEDGNYYLQAGFMQMDTNHSTCTVTCLDEKGNERWIQTSDSGLIVWGICSDGTAILRQDIYDLNVTPPGIIIVKQELISVSSDGNILGRLSLPSNAFNAFRLYEQESNGTIVAYFEDVMNFTTYHYMGMTEDLQHNWSLKTSNMEDRGKTIGSVTYKINNTGVVGDNGNTYSIATLGAYNASDGTLLFKTDFQGISFYWVDVNSGTVYVEDRAGSFWAVDQEGQANFALGAAGWQAFDTYGNGLLLYGSSSIKLIDDQGSPEWQYDLEEGTIKSVHVGTDSTIYLITDVGISAVHKPQVSTTMVYIVALISIDILVILTCGLWLMDHRLPEERHGP
ncbi:MAG TPA: PQQ-binding-like beta-propeller repeat protein [Methanomassiliicoccales archaeon]